VGIWRLGAAMPETWVTIIVAVIAAVLGGSGGGFVVGRYRAKTEREQVLATAAQAATAVALTAWRDLADAREQEARVLRERLTEVECRLTETERRLSETERQLRTAQERNAKLEVQVAALERERASWRQERAKLMKRIEELEACK
jgi:uncharacterized protein HemX